MLTYLIDTNVVSEATKPQPNAGVQAWMAAVDPSQCGLSVLTIGELRRGVAVLEGRGAAAKAQRIAGWLAQLQEEYSDRLLSITPAVVQVWAYLPGQPTSIDSLIAATALAHDLTVVTRNVGDFAGTGVRLLNPFGG